MALLIEYLGWAATAVFVGSYLCKRPEALKRMQMFGALMWVAYGLMIQAVPVVAANLLVFGAAGWALTQSSGGNGNGRRLQHQGHQAHEAHQEN